VSLAYLEDRLAINDLFVRYTTALDRGDVETIVDCFTPDGSLDSPAVGGMPGTRRSAPLPNGSPGFTSAARSCAT
jgi:hypothetical protein